MESIASDVVGGFNRFIADQRAAGDDAILTLVQFDSQNPYEVLVDAAPIAEAPVLDRSSFQPRGGTPLFDAIGQLLRAGADRGTARAAEGLEAEDVLVVLFTDGEENSSTTYSRQAIADLIAAKEAAGWTFTYLGANQDAFQSGADLGISAGNVSNFIADTDGTVAMFSDLSTNVTAMRSAKRRGKKVDKDALFSVRSAQEDFEDRS
jgi:hypothetical protein